MGNIIADKLANKAIDETLNRNTSKTSPISIATTKHMVETTILNQEKSKQQQTKEKHVISNILNKWNTLAEYQQINIDIEILDKLKFCILTQLRTNHIKLNFYFHQLNHMEFYKNDNNMIFMCKNNCCIDNNNGYCLYCDKKIETVYHFIMECNKYNKQRNILYLSTMKIFHLYQLTFSLKNLLFPPTNIKIYFIENPFSYICYYYS